MSLQHELQLQPNDENIIYKETEARNNFMQALKQEESFAKQKSRQHWLTLGDIPILNFSMLQLLLEGLLTVSANAETKMIILLRI